jgi:hypothetical protein
MKPFRDYINESVTVFRGDSSKINVHDFDPSYGVSKLGKDLGSSAAFGPGIYFTTAKDVALMYGRHLTTVTIADTTKIKTRTSPKLSHNQILKILDSIDAFTLKVAVSNWDEDFNKGKDALVQNIMSEDDVVEQLMSIWADVFSHQNHAKFMKIMVKIGIDGLSLQKEDVTYYVIYNKGIIK